MTVDFCPKISFLRRLFMFVHLGGNVSVIDSEIAAIINLETCTSGSDIMNSFLRAEEESLRIEDIEGDIPKSLVITSTKTYVSPLSNTVLLRRLNKFDISD
jgi:hypothetical protein